MVTQYRVAENSAVINTLIAAAQNGKKVTVFVELKARFDEENNLATAEMMQAAGIKIIYSIPGLKVHAKVALIRRRGLNGEKKPSYAYISTGNFNEKNRHPLRRLWTFHLPPEDSGASITSSAPCKEKKTRSSPPFLSPVSTSSPN